MHDTGGGPGLARSGRAEISAQYNVASTTGIPARIAEYQRKKMFRAFLAFAAAAPSDTILDIGVTSDRAYGHSNYLEAWYGRKESITAIGLDDASFLPRAYPGLRFLRADARALPFRDGSFDFAHSSAVLEHVGSRERQAQFVREAWRICRKGLFVTTPNRWLPVEFHTLLP